MFKRLIGECVGSFSLVFFGCGSTALASGYFRPDIGLVCQAVAFGLAATTLVYVLRPVCAAHFNPAVTVGFAIANRFPVRDLVPVISAQVGGRPPVLGSYISSRAPARAPRLISSRSAPMVTGLIPLPDISCTLR